jgi:hypothetical protein
MDQPQPIKATNAGLCRQLEASYSGDVIAQSGRIRKPVWYAGRLWIAVGVVYHGVSVEEVSCHEMVPLALYRGDVEPWREWHYREDRCPEDYYPGRIVKYGGREYVMCRQELVATPGDVAGEPVQLSLFDLSGPLWGAEERRA